MKKLTMWLGCALTAFAIGCSDGGSTSTAPATPDPKKMMDPAKMAEEMQKKNAAKTPAAGDASADKKDEATEKDDAADKKDDAADKKDDAADKKDEATEK